MDVFKFIFKEYIFQAGIYWPRGNREIGPLGNLSQKQMWKPNVKTVSPAKTVLYVLLKK